MYVNLYHDLLGDLLFQPYAVDLLSILFVSIVNLKIYNIAHIYKCNVQECYSSLGNVNPKLSI